MWSPSRVMSFYGAFQLLWRVKAFSSLFLSVSASLSFRVVLHGLQLCDVFLLRADHKDHRSGLRQ